jgi:hypothetical protein
LAFLILSRRILITGAILAVIFASGPSDVHTTSCLLSLQLVSNVDLDDEGVFKLGSVLQPLLLETCFDVLRCVRLRGHLGSSALPLSSRRILRI